jgi:hypothetical protein
LENNKIKLIILIIVFTLNFTNVFSIDFGGTLDNKTSLNWEDDLTVGEKIKLSMWFTSQFNENLNFFTKGNYTFSKEGTNHTGDLDRLYLEGEYPLYNFGSSLLRFSAGRFQFSDFTDNVINHKLDGLSFSLEFPIMKVTLSAGYSGLLFDHSNNISMTKSDDTDKADEDTIIGSTRRIIEGAEFYFPQLFLKQSLNLSFWFQQDLRNDNLLSAGETVEDSSTGGIMNTQYMGAGISGGFASKFYYDGFFFLGTGKTLSYIDGEYEEATMLSFLAGGGLRIYLKEALYSFINVKLVYSSGDSDSDTYFREGNTGDNATMFVPISRTSTGLIFSPELGNILYVKAGYSIKPFSKMDSRIMENLQTAVNGTAFFRSSTGQISESGLNTGSSSLYLGTEIDIIINFRPLSDLGAALSVGLFFPSSGSSGALADSENQTLVKFDLSYSF